MASNSVILVTGCSSGFGAAIAAVALERGHRVIATCRGDAPTRLSSLVAAGANPLSLDVCETPARIDAVVRQAVAMYGRIDVLVNNAGYVHQGAHEELTHEEERAAYETNVFGALKVTRTLLPYFRAQKSGLVLNMSSHCGRWSRATYAVYSGTKFALEGFSEALACETEHLGITVCALEPGTFATSVLEPERCLMPPENRLISDYAPCTSVVRAHLSRVSTSKRGSPEQAASAIVDLVEHVQRGGKLPRRLAMGEDAYTSIKEMHTQQLAELERYRRFSTDLVFREEV